MAVVVKEIDDNCSTDYVHFMGELDELVEEIYFKLKSLKGHEDLIRHLKYLQDAARDISVWAKDYDYPGIQANGYWSGLRIGIKLAKVVRDTLEENSNEQNIPQNHSLVILSKYFLVAVDVLKNLRQDSLVNGSTGLHASSGTYFVEMFVLLLSLDDELIAAMYGPYCGFWLCPSARNVMVFLVTVLSISGSNLRSAFSCIWSPEHRGLVLAKLIRSAKASFVKNLAAFAEGPWYTVLLPLLMYRHLPEKRKVIQVPRQGKWIISLQRRAVIDTCEGRRVRFSTSKTVRCLLLLRTSGGINDGNALILHCHGGGFICGTPYSHEVYLRGWANNVPGIPILSVDYTVSPEGKFPIALQEILDVYLWVTSRDPGVTDLLGFQPRKLILVGDSAGGNLVTALTLVLNDIRKIQQLNGISIKTHGNDIVMPRALIPIYSPLNLKLLLCPSNILACCDSMISAGVILSCFDAYVPRKQTEVNSNFYGLAIEKLLQLKGAEILKSAFRILSGFFAKIFALQEAKPWYLSSKSELSIQMEEFAQVTSWSYVSPLYYKDIESLSSISLYLITSHYDPFLDDSVSFAKAWKGPVKFDVLDGLQHSFLNFLPFSDEAQKGSDLCAQRLIEAINQAHDDGDS